MRSFGCTAFIYIGLDCDTGCLHNNLKIPTREPQSPKAMPVVPSALGLDWFIIGDEIVTSDNNNKQLSFQTTSACP